MPKHHEKKPHNKGVGLKLIDKPDELINLLITDPQQNEWAAEQVTNEGPNHKQVYSALLLNRMYKLVQSIECSAGVSFIVQKGLEIISAKHEEEFTIPVQLPATAVKKEQTEEVLKVLSHAPEHELIAFTALLQAIEWSIKAMAKELKIQMNTF